MDGNKKLSAPKKHLSLGRAKVKLLSAYYGHPAKDLRLICITGSTGKATVAHFVYEILRAAGQPVQILASDGEIKPTTLHKFLNDAWKAKATYVVITAPASALEADTFFGLPIHTAALTDFIPSGLGDPSAKQYLAAKASLFAMNPQNIILNRDDINYPAFSEFHGQNATLTYGTSSDSDLRIERHQLYKKGSEANLSFDRRLFNVASFLPGEPTVSYMACAAAIATTLNLSPDIIAEGIANYEP